jgi:hypothetical protein
MEKVYVHDIKDEKSLETLIKWYDQYSTTATYVRKEIVTMYRKRRQSQYKVPSTWTNDVARPLVEIVCNRPFEVTGSIG